MRHAAQHARAALKRGALHVVHHAVQAAHLLAAAGASGTAMDQVRKRRAVAGGFLRAIAVENEQTAVECARAGQHLTRDVRIVSVERHHQRTLAAIDERDGVGEIAIGHQRRDGAEGFGVVHAVRLPRRVAAQQHRLHERAFAVRLVRIADDDARFGRAASSIFARTSSRCAVETSAPILVVFARGSPTVTSPSAVLSAASAASITDGGHEGAADGGAFLPGLHRHLAHDFLDEEIELRRAWRGIGAEHRGVQRVTLRDEAHALARDHGMALEFLPRCRRSR